MYDEAVKDTDFRVMCRACALRFDSTVLRDITPPIRESYLFCTGIEVDLSSDLPTRLCGTCLSRLDNASQYKLQCHQSERKLRLSAKTCQVVSSTPRNDEVISPFILPDQLGGNSFRSPMSELSELDVPLTPLTASGCDVKLDEDIKQNGGATPNLEDTTSMTDFLNSILEQKESSNSKKNEQEVQDHIINPDSVLSFLNYQGTSWKRSENMLDDSFSLIANLSSPVKEESIPALQIDEFIIKPEKIDYIMKPEKFDNEKISTDIYADIEYNDINDNIKADVKEIDSEINIKCDDNVERNKITTLAPVITDFIKQAMPNNTVQVELKELGHVRCRYCYNQFSEAEILYKHLENEHAMECLHQTDGSDFVKMCYPEKSVSQILKHNGFLLCKCDAITKSVSEFYRHLKIKHSKRLMEDGMKLLFWKKYRKVYICDYCGKKYSRRKAFCSHVRLHNENPALYEKSCHKCKRDFPTRSSYIEHMKSHQLKVYGSPQLKKNAGFTCNVCGKTLSTRCNLNAHLRRHDSQATSACSICNKVYKMPNDLKRHMQVHNNPKSYECGICKKQFSRSDHLTKHSRVHSGERTYQCRQCVLYFLRNTDLNRHIKRIHRMNKVLKYETDSTDCED